MNEYKKMDKLLCPVLIIEREYDYIVGNKNSVISCEYHTSDRKFLYVKSGNIKIKMGISCEAVENEPELETELESNKELEKKVIESDESITVYLLEGYIISIPSYWNYKIMFEEKSVIMSYTYRSLINIVTNKIKNNLGYYKETIEKACALNV